MAEQGQDFRARLKPKNIKDCADILGNREPSNILYPLFATNGVLFPYTPDISHGYKAEYESTAFIHSIYGYNAYIRSYPKEISLEAEFTAQTDNEAMYLLAVTHFFRSSVKSYFGSLNYKKAGTPPPVFLFDYMGDFQFSDVPVVIKDLNYTFPKTIDYVPVFTGETSEGIYSDGVSVPFKNHSGYTLVPTRMTFSISLDFQYTPIDLRDNFDLDEFRNGNLITGGYI